MRKVSVKPCRFDKMFMNKDLIEDKFYLITDQFNERKNTPIKFYSILLNEIHQFYDRNGRTYEILFANNKIMYLTDKIEIIKMMESQKKKNENTNNVK